MSASNQHSELRDLEQWMNVWAPRPHKETLQSLIRGLEVAMNERDRLGALERTLELIDQEHAQCIVIACPTCALLAKELA